MNEDYLCRGVVALLMHRYPCNKNAHFNNFHDFSPLDLADKTCAMNKKDMQISASHKT